MRIRHQFQFAVRGDTPDELIERAIELSTRFFGEAPADLVLTTQPAIIHTGQGGAGPRYTSNGHATVSSTRTLVEPTAKATGPLRDYTDAEVMARRLRDD